MPEQRSRGESSNIKDFSKEKERLTNKRKKIEDAVRSILKMMDIEDSNNEYVEEVKVDFGTKEEGWKITLVNPSFENYPDFLQQVNPEEDMEYKLKKEIERRDDLQINNENGIEKVFIEKTNKE
jgi:hypothetical protein